MKKKSGISIYLMQILFALVPLFVGIIVVTVSSVLQLDSQMEKSTFSRLETAAIATARYFEYDINEGILAQDDTSFEYCDSFQKYGVDVTLFIEDTRYITSLKNADGTRNIGTKADSGIYQTVKSGSNVEKKKRNHRWQKVLRLLYAYLFRRRYVLWNELCRRAYGNG